MSSAVLFRQRIGSKLRSLPFKPYLAPHYHCISFLAVHPSLGCFQNHTNSKCMQTIMNRTIAYDTRFGIGFLFCFLPPVHIVFNLFQQIICVFSRFSARTDKFGLSNKRCKQKNNWKNRSAQLRK